MKNKKNIVLFLALLALFLFIGGAVTSYAKYFKKSEKPIVTSIKRWDITVNNESIRNETTLTKNITATFKNEDGNIKEDTIAPGATGSFQIVIDYTNVDVNFTYDLSIAKNEDIPDFKLKKIKVDGVEITPTVDSDGVTHVVGDIDVSTTTKTQTIDAEIEWNDETTNELDDNEDTEIGINKDNINFDVKMSFIQKN